MAQPALDGVVRGPDEFARRYRRLTYDELGRLVDRPAGRPTPEASPSQ